MCAQLLSSTSNGKFLSTLSPSFPPLLDLIILIRGVRTFMAEHPAPSHGTQIERIQDHVLKEDLCELAMAQVAFISAHWPSPHKFTWNPPKDSVPHPLRTLLLSRLQRSSLRIPSASSLVDLQAVCVVLHGIVADLHSGTFAPPSSGSPLPAVAAAPWNESALRGMRARVAPDLVLRVLDVFPADVLSGWCTVASLLSRQAGMPRLPEHIREEILAFVRRHAASRWLRLFLQMQSPDLRTVKHVLDAWQANYRPPKPDTFFFLVAALTYRTTIVLFSPQHGVEFDLRHLPTLSSFRRHLKADELHLLNLGSSVWHVGLLANETCALPMVPTEVPMFVCGDIIRKLSVNCAQDDANEVWPLQPGAPSSTTL